MNDEKSPRDILAALDTAYIDAIDAYELAIDAVRRANGHRAYYEAFNDVIHAANAARDTLDALDAYYAATEEKE